MLDIIIDTILDTAKLLPFLYLAFLLIEFLEHKIKNKDILDKTGRFGPLLGGILGAIPQCGFASAATNLYVTRIISLGTLISIYLSTSDEMLPIMISQNVEITFIIKIILIKVIIGIVFGFIIDLVYRKKLSSNVHELCEHDDCHCEDNNIFKSSLIHTLKITIYILIVNLVLNSVFYFGGEEFLSKLLLNNTYFASFITSLIGLIPNCASSVILTELYLSNSIGLGSMIGGLLTGSGIAIVILFKTNKNIKENITILSIVYLIGSIMGLIINLI